MATLVFTRMSICVCVHTYGGLLTFEEALDSQVAHAKSEHGQFVQARTDVLGEGQQIGQAIQLPVQPIPVALGRVRLDDPIHSRELLAAGE